MKNHVGIGLMSGTSLDGLDICMVHFDEDCSRYQILEAETLPYTEEWRARLKNAVRFSGEELSRLDFDYGRYLGKEVSGFLNRHPSAKPDYIASHGHTVFHRPDLGYTLQIGRGEALFAECGITTIWDFRSEDVANGGQGAPLVPIGDRMLFSDYEACLNLGGFSNISFEENEKRIAFDICPVNIVLNALAGKMGKKYDADGRIAASGTIISGLLKELNALDYYKLPAPKSLGFEWVREKVSPLLEAYEPETPDLIATFTEHAAQQLAEVFNRYRFSDVLITGGGAYNTFLTESVKARTKSQIIIPDAQTIEYKEALIFALMGLLRLQGSTNVLCSATGGKVNLSSGRIISS